MQGTDPGYVLPEMFCDFVRQGVQMAESIELCGLEAVGFTQQALFLMALGLGDRIAALSTTVSDVATLLRRREALHRAIDPMGLGGFGVLVQSKGLRDGEKVRSIKGFTVP